MDQKNARIRKKRYWVILAILGTLLLFRILLPVVVKHYVNNVLADIPGYYGEVTDIDLALIRGAYVIKGLYLNKINAGSQVPFLDFKKTDISIEWNSLLKGRVVSEIVLYEPTLIYVFEDQRPEATDPALEDWTTALTDLVPIDIDHLEIIDGKAAFVELSADPDIDLSLFDIDLSATNLQNVVQKERTLPSEVHATAISLGNGTVTLDGKLNLVKEIPDMDISFALENADATALNDVTNHYAGIDFKEGSFNLYSEVAIADGFLKGYIKPLLKDTTFIGKDDGFLKTLWEGFVGFFKFILKNHKNNTLATRIPIEGDLNNVSSKAWPAIFNIFKNAWIKGFQNVLDGDVDFQDAEEGADKKNT